MVKTQSPELTRFGATVLALMSEAGIRQVSGLIERLRDVGYDYGHSRISNWLYGRHPVDRKFPKALSAALNLDEGERKRLALAFAFGQEEPATNSEKP